MYFLKQSIYNLTSPSYILRQLRMLSKESIEKQESQGDADGNGVEDESWRENLPDHQMPSQCIDRYGSEQQLELKEISISFDSKGKGFAI